MTRAGGALGRKEKGRKEKQKWSMVKLTRRRADPRPIERAPTRDGARRAIRCSCRSVHRPRSSRLITRERLAGPKGRDGGGQPLCCSSGGHPPPLTLSNGRRDGLASAGERWDAILDSFVQSGEVVGLGALLLKLPVLAVPAMVGPVSNHLSEREAQTISPHSRSMLKPDSIITFLCASSFFCSAVAVSSSTRSSA
jgi:hypothetical protein